MRILKPDNLGFLYRVITREGGFGLVASAFACFSLREADQGTLLSEAEMWGLLRKGLQPGTIFDQGYPKPGAEFLLYGRCFPSLEERTGMEVSVRVGNRNKTLQIMGPRYWRDGYCSAPEPLDPVRLDWTNAYGGPEYSFNPLGKGHCINRPADELAAPQLLRPGALLTSAGETHEPVSFAALPPFWPQRAQFLGAFDKKWRLTEWPYFPSESSAEFLFTAQPDQRMPTFFQGNETLAITGAHPRRMVITGTLPKLRARLFAMTRKNGTEAFAEMPAPADTLWLLPEQEVAILCYRGVLQNVDEDAEDVAHLIAAWEPQNNTPLPAEHYLEQLRAESGQASKETPGPAAKTAASAAGPAPEAPKPPPRPSPKAPKAPPQPEAPSAEMQSLQREVEKFEAEMHQQMKKANVTQEQVDAFLKSREPVFKDPCPGGGIGENLAAFEREVHQAIARSGVDMQQVKRLLAKKQDEPPSLEKSAQFFQNILDKQSLGQEQRDAVKNLRDAHYELADIARELDEVEQRQKQEAEQAADAAPSEPEPATETKGYAGKDFSGADFSGKNFTHVDFQNAILSGADFSDAVLTGADFSGAVLNNAVFTGAHLVNTRLVGVQANGAKCDKTELFGADLSNAHFSDSDFTEAGFNQANLTNCDFSNAMLSRIKAVGTKAEKASFAHADLTDASFFNADLRGAEFTYALLHRVDFRASNADKSEFYGAYGEQTVFHHVSLVNSRGDKHTRFPGVALRNIDMRDVRWSGVDLQGARLWEVNMERGDFSRTVLKKISMLRVQARGTNADKSSIEGSSLRRVNMFLGSLRKSRIINTRVHLANLFGVDHYGLYIRNRRAKNSNVKRTLRERATEDA